MFETFDHTADVGLRIRAADLTSLFEEAGRGLFSLLVDNLDEVQPVEEFTLDIAGGQRDYLLFDWLNELLYRFETQRVAFSRFEVNLDENGIHAKLFGESVDSERHKLAHEVKAITYHQLTVEQTSDDWLAEVIVDI